MITARKTCFQCSFEHLTAVLRQTCSQVISTAPKWSTKKGKKPYYTAMFKFFTLQLNGPQPMMSQYHFGDNLASNTSFNLRTRPSPFPFPLNSFFSYVSFSILALSLSFSIFITYPSFPPSIIFLH